MMATVASVGLAAAMGQPISPFPSLDKTQHLHRHAGFLGGVFTFISLGRCLGAVFTLRSFVWGSTCNIENFF